MIFAGLSGVGKSTVSTYLFARINAGFLSDNLLYYDDSKVYPCFEPILLSQKSTGMLPAHDGRLVTTGLTSVYDRKGYQIGREHLRSEAIPNWVFLLSLSPSPYLRTIPRRRMLARLLDSNEATGEIKRYHTFSAQMNLLYDREPLHLARASTLERFLGGVQCFEVGLRFDGDIEQSVERTILSVL